MLTSRDRIMVIGAGGAGKSTFSRRLAEITGLPLIHLDRHHWKPGWEPTPADEWSEVVRSLASGERWIIDGNYGGTLGIRMSRCDAIVFFDFDRVTCIRGVIKRWLLRRPRPDMVQENAERLDLSFLRWIWNYGKVSRPRIIEAIRGIGSDVEVIVVKDRRQVRELLDTLRRA